MPLVERCAPRADPYAKVNPAIEEFVRFVQQNETGTKLYASWHQKDDPSRFVHLFIFEEDAAHKAHGESSAVRAFEAVYTPELVGGPVIFTDYLQIATNS